MAGVSAADVRSVLSLPTPGPSAGPSQSELFLAATQPKERKRKPEGISRELYSLIGDSTPSLQAQFAKPRLKQKPNFGSGGSVRWEWRPFKNDARKDSLQLGHWVKASSDPNAEYPFAKYNAKPNVYDYSLDEYTRFLDDPEWTKEETDYLFDLMKEYDSRFYVVHDRYDFPGGIPRSLEDLKDRYCSVCRKLLRNRPWAGDETSKVKLMQSFEFDKEQEVTRKKYVASLESRTPDQIAEEEALFIEIKRLEQTERRFKKERDELLRRLLGVESGLPDLPVEEESPMAPFADTKSKKKKNHPYGSVSAGPMDVDSPSSSVAPSVISLGQPVQRKQSAKQMAQDALHCIHRTDPPATNATKSHQAAHLRSSKIPYPKPASNSPKIIQCLQELGVNHLRLIMPTRENIAQLEGVMDAASALVETKKVFDRVEQEIRTLKLRLGEKDEGDAEGEADAEGSAVGETPTTGTPMDADMGEGEVEEGSRDGRAQSVMSSVSRAGRNRKASRRSMSISSVDTSATGATSKRQRKR